MGGMGGGGMSFLPWMNTNTGQTYSGTEIVKNFFNPGSMGGVFGSGMGSGQDAPAQIDEPPPPEIPEDPAIAQMAMSEEARQEAMRKRRLRTKTLLSDQSEQGQATVGTKVLLGG